MKNFISVVIVCGSIIGAQAAAQVKTEERQHEEHITPPDKAQNPPRKTGLAACCEGMDKMGEVNGGMPMKGDIKVKMEKMKEMKEKMAEKMGMKTTEGGKPNAENKSTELKDVEKNAYQH